MLGYKLGKLAIRDTAVSHSIQSKCYKEASHISTTTNNMGDTILSKDNIPNNSGALLHRFPCLVLKSSHHAVHYLLLYPTLSLCTCP